MLALVQLDPNQVLGLGRVFHVVTRVVGEDAGVASAEVKGAGVGAAEEDGGAGATLGEEEPFFRLDASFSRLCKGRGESAYVGMPVQLSKASRFDYDDRCCDGFCGREITRIHD